jgi:uncharacterized OB-fold protein
MTHLPRFDPPLDELAAPFWDAIEQGHLALPRCSSCGRWQWYPDAAGPDCGDGHYLWEQVATTGRVHTLTRVRRPFLPGSNAEHLPVVVGFIELDGVDGVRLVANLADDEHVVIGARVRATFERLGARQHPVFVLDEAAGEG